MRAILVRVPNSVHATWHATMLVSSLLVSATIMSAVAGAGRFERARTRGVALHGADVDAVLQVAQQALVEVDDGDVVRFFAGQVVRRGPADLAGPEDDYFQVLDLWGSASF